MSLNWQMVLAVPAVALASGVAHALFWSILRLTSGVLDTFSNWWRGENLIPLVIGVTCGFIAYFLLMMSADRLPDNRFLTRASAATVTASCIALIPGAVMLSVVSLSAVAGLGSIAADFGQLFWAALPLLGVAVYPALCGTLWAVIDWIPFDREIEEQP